MSGRVTGQTGTRNTVAAWVITGMLSGASLLTSGCAETNSPMVVRHRAMLAEQRGDRETALTIREQFLTDFPEYLFLSEVYFEQGMTFLSLNKPEKAIDFFDKAIEEDSEYLQAFIRRCQTNHLLGRHEAAIADGNRAMELSVNDRDLARAFVYQGNSQAELKRPGRAIVKWQMALLLDPDQMPALRRLFDTYLENNEPHEALLIIEDSLKHNPRFAEKQLMYSRVLARLDRREEAAAALDRAYELNIGDAIELPDSVDDLMSETIVEVAPLMHTAARPVPPVESTPAPAPSPQSIEQTALEIARAYLIEQGIEVLPASEEHRHLLSCKQEQQTFDVLIKTVDDAGTGEFSVSQEELELITQTTPPRGMLLVARAASDSATQPTPTTSPSGRVTAFARSWRPDPERLTPLTFSYTLPQPSATKVD